MGLIVVRDGLPGSDTRQLEQLTSPLSGESSAFTLQVGILVAVSVLSGLGAPVYTGHRALVTTVILALASGLQNATVRRLAAPDLTTTVLTQTLTGLAADSALAHGPGTRARRRCRPRRHPGRGNPEVASASQTDVDAEQSIVATRWGCRDPHHGACGGIVRGDENRAERILVAASAMVR